MSSFSLSLAAAVGHLSLYVSLILVLLSLFLPLGIVDSLQYTPCSLILIYLPKGCYLFSFSFFCYVFLTLSLAANVLLYFVLLCCSSLSLSLTLGCGKYYTSCWRFFMFRCLFVACWCYFSSLCVGLLTILLFPLLKIYVL
jgi:hypothetical protein